MNLEKEKIQKAIETLQSPPFNYTFHIDLYDPNVYESIVNEKLPIGSRSTKNVYKYTIKDNKRFFNEHTEELYVYLDKCNSTDLSNLGHDCGYTIKFPCIKIMSSTDRDAFSQLINMRKFLTEDHVRDPFGSDFFKVFRWYECINILSRHSEKNLSDSIIELMEYIEKYSYIFFRRDEDFKFFSLMMKKEFASEEIKFHDLLI